MKNHLRQQTVKKLLYEFHISERKPLKQFDESRHWDWQFGSNRLALLDWMPERQTVKCPVCGCVFAPRNKASKTCSVKCRLHLAQKASVDVKKKRAAVMRQCKECGKTWVGRLSDKKIYCSPKCACDGRKNSNTHLLRTCEWCGKEFRRWGNHKIKFCSIACRIGHQRRNKLNSRIAQNLRSRISKIIREKSLGGRTRRLLGCSYNELIAHLQSQWKPGMTWANYGTAWHVDHIIACANYNQRNPIHVKECHHFTNLQPLWASENISKGASL